MIDKVRIEQLLTLLREVRHLGALRNVDRSTITEVEFARRHAAWTKAKRTIERSQTVENQIEILTDYLAMREIVAEIATEERVTTGLDGLPHCSTCGAGLSEQHRPNCWYTRSVALIGPASEREGE